MQPLFAHLNYFFLKFGLFEKHSKFEINLPYGFDKSADLLSKRQSHKKYFFKICLLFRKSELYPQGTYFMKYILTVLILIFQ